MALDDTSAVNHGQSDPIGTPQRPNGTAPRKPRTAVPSTRESANTAPLMVPVEVGEQSDKPKRDKVVVTRGVSAEGKRIITMTPAKGFQIARIVIFDLDPKTKRARFKVIARHSRGRPHASQNGESS